MVLLILKVMVSMKKMMSRKVMFVIDVVGIVDFSFWDVSFILVFGFFFEW